MEFLQLLAARLLHYGHTIPRNSGIFQKVYYNENEDTETLAGLDNKDISNAQTIDFLHKDIKKRLTSYEYACFMKSVNGTLGKANKANIKEYKAVTKAKNKLASDPFLRNYLK